MNQVKTPWSYWNLKRPIISHLKQKSNFICKAYAVREASIWASASVLAWYLRIGQVHYRRSRVLHIHLLGICFIISFYQSVLDTSRLFNTMRSEEISLSQHKIQLHLCLCSALLDFAPRFSSHSNATTSKLFASASWSAARLACLWVFGSIPFARFSLASLCLSRAALRLISG